MFDLDEAISKWRKQTSCAGIKSADVLNELESHLRDEINALCASGVSQPQAFQTAIARLGPVGAMKGEFMKIQNKRWERATMVPWAWLVVVILLSVIQLLTSVVAGRINFLMFTHILTLTAGYGAALLAGSIGIGYVCRRWTQRFTNSPRSSLIGAVTSFTRISAILIVAGYLLGMLWSKQNRGTFFSGSAREIGPIFVLTWVLIELFVQRFFRASTQIIILLAIAGNIVVSLAWFGMLIVVSRSYEFGNHIPFVSFITVHCIFLVIAALPERSTLVQE